MKNKIIEALDKSGVDGYILSITNTISSQMFFIKKELDMVRKSKTQKISVTVYHDFEFNNIKMRGSANASLYDGMDMDELTATIKAAYNAAGHAKNPYYELAEGKKADLVDMQSDMNNNSHEENCRIMAEALFAEDNDNETYLNSAELFVTETTKNIVTSEGGDVSYRKWNVNGEFVAQSVIESDVETYQQFSYENLEADALRSKVKNILEYTKARSIAKETPESGNYRVIISGAYMKTLFSYYVDKAMVAYIYAKYSKFKLGEAVPEANGLNITLKASVPFSNEGIEMKDRTLLENGILKTYHGDTRFSRYLGCDITGYYRDFKVETGSRTFEEMKQKPYLHVVNFSDFQMDPFTGHFGGEIRLAFLFDGEKITPVTGGSINGSIFECAGSMELSADVLKDDGYEGPIAVAFDNVPVAGK